MASERPMEPQGLAHAGQRHTQERPFNLGDGERIGSLALGALLTLQGLKRRSLLGTLTAGAGALLIARGVTGHSRVYERLGVERPDAPVEITRSVTINRTPEEVYQFWRDFTNLPRFMRHLRAVTIEDETHSRWTAQPPLGGPALEWRAETTEDRPNELISWRSLPGSDIENSGSVRVRPAPGGRGTEVHVTLSYRPPVGVALAKLMAPVSAQMLKEEIRALQHLLETGEIPTTKGQPSARHAASAQATNARNAS